ncbi:hypothetical protein HPP92_009016 [Vanilla planifolia]|uniref:Biogenesis of lysosome-related organelles complex 1 subunit 1 n=1 Tax=Vanilla planifolia TaxID=51239 RepID=A0A835REW2_VANPL|nr:hypothetical protein HPP92_009016 [Vanilla planifolia]
MGLTSGRDSGAGPLVGRTRVHFGGGARRTARQRQPRAAEGAGPGKSCRLTLKMEGSKVETTDLESSLVQIIQEHQQRALLIRDSADKAKKDALKTAVRVSELLVDTVNGRVEEAFVNEKRIELEIRSLVNTVARYKKQTNQWLSASNAMSSVLKEIGDFENWMKVMDFDCKSINAAIRNIHQA